MKFFLKWGLRLIFLFVFLVSLLILFRNSIGIWVGTYYLEKLIPFQVSIAYMDIGLVHSRIIAREVILLNPDKHFKEPIAGRIKRIEMDYQPISFLMQRPRINRLNLEMENISLIRNSKGQINLEVLNFVRKSKKSREVFTDEMVLSLKTLIYLEENQEKPARHLYTFKGNQRTYKNLRSVEEIQDRFYDFILQSTPDPVENSLKKPIPESDFFHKIWENIRTFFSTLRNKSALPD